MPEPLQLVAGRNRGRAPTTTSGRFVGAGLVHRVPMTRGDGSLIVVTPTGAGMAGHRYLGELDFPRLRARRKRHRPYGDARAGRGWRNDA